MKLSSNLWYGSEDSFFVVVRAQEEVAKLQAAGPEAMKAAVIAAGGGRGEDPYGFPPLWNLNGSVAVVNISGSLVDGHAGFGRLFGVIGYADIQHALAEIALHKEATSVLLNIDSGGGQVSGVEETGDMIRALDAQKPVFSYTGDMMGSAAFWLGASARHISANRTSTVGSVGTLIMHIERSKQLEDAGIKATIIRYGKFKALNNPYEPLSEEGRAQLQNLADEAGKVFVEYVSDRRGMTAAAFQKTAGEGRVFPGAQAKEVGLIDDVMSLGQAIKHAKSLDKPKAHQHNPGNSRKATHMFTKKTLLAIAAGTALDQLGLTAADAYSEGKVPEGDALAAAQAEASEVHAAVEARVTAACADATAKVTELTAKLADAEKAKDEAVAAKATFEAASNDFQAKLKTSSEHAAKADAIVKASISVMSVALGGAADVGASLTGSELLAEHDRLKEQFAAKFPTGGVAAVVAKTKASQQAPVNPMFAALVQSAKTK